MENVRAGIDALKKAAKLATAPKDIRDTIDHVGTCLVLLNLSKLSPRSTSKLISLLREPIVPLYVALTVPALQFAASVFASIFNDRISVALQNNDHKETKAWEDVGSALLSGLLDFAETKGTAENKDSIATAFYTLLSNIYFPKDVSSSILETGSTLRCSVYLLFTETAKDHPSNQHKLRDPNILGGERFGRILLQTKCYLSLETLLQLFARILPLVRESPSGRGKRTKFVHQVFVAGSPKGFEHGKELAHMMESVLKSEWEATALKIVEFLAAGDVTYPQPFKVDEVRSCNKTFPQTGAEDRLYVDKRSFFANVDEGESIETFQVTYNSILSINVSSQASSCGVIIYLSELPAVGFAPLTCPPNGQSKTMAFDLKKEDVKRFLTALENRGLGDRILQSKTKYSAPRLSLPTAPVKMFASDSDNKSTDQVALAEYVHEFYSDLSGGHLPSDSVEELVSRPPSRSNRNQFTEKHKRTTMEMTDSSPNLETITHGAHLAASFKHATTASHSAVNSAPAIGYSQTSDAHNAIFGDSDDELSDISEDYSAYEPTQTTAIVPGRANGKTVFDSDDEQVPIASRTRRIQKAKKAFIPSREFVSDVDTAAENPVRMTTTSTEADKNSNTDITKLPAGFAGRKSSTGTRTSLLPLSATVTEATSRVVRAGRVTGGELRSVTSTLFNPNSPTLPEHVISAIDAQATKAARRVTRSGGRTQAAKFNELPNAGAKARTPPENVGKKGGLSHDALEVVKVQISPGRGVYKAPTTITKTCTVAKTEIPAVEFTQVSKRKRNAPEDRRHTPDPSSENLEASRRPTKRSRVTENTVAAVINPKASPSPTTRNTRSNKQKAKKGRTLAPTPLPSVVDDNGAPAEYLLSPSAPAPMQSRTCQDNDPKNEKKKPIPTPSKKTLVSAMKRKGELSTSTTISKTNVETIEPQIERITQASDNKDTANTSIAEHIQFAKRRVEKGNVTSHSTMAPENPKVLSNDVASASASKDHGRSNSTYGMQNNVMKIIPRLDSPRSQPSPTLQDLVEAPWEAAESLNSTNVAAETSNGKTESSMPVGEVSSNHASKSADDFALDLGVDHCHQQDVNFLIPTELKSFPDSSYRSATPQTDFVMIDLTKEGTPIKPKGSAHHKKTSSLLVVPNPGLSPVGSPDGLHLPTDSASVVQPLRIQNRPRYSVTFASTIASPVASHVQPSERPTHVAVSSPMIDSKKKSTLVTRPQKAYDNPLRRDHGLTREHRSSGRLDRQEPGIEDIVNVLNEIQEVMVGKILRKIGNAKTGMRNGRNAILFDAAADLESLHGDSMAHFQKLLHLEKQYSKTQRTLVDGYEAACKINQDIGLNLREIIADHDHNTLSKKLPLSLFSSPLPSILSNPLQL